MSSRDLALTLSITGSCICFFALALAIWSYLRMRGMNAGSAASAAAIVIAVIGIIPCILGAVIATHG